MKAWVVSLVAVLAVMPAQAEDVPFNGRTLEVAADQEAQPILRMVGTRYALPRTQVQLLERAKTCLGGQAEVSIASEDAETGIIEADVRIPFRSGFSDRVVRSRLTLELGEGYFQLTESALAQARTDRGEGEAELFEPLVKSDGIWEKALRALTDRETGWTDCLYK